MKTILLIAVVIIVPLRQTYAQYFYPIELEKRFGMYFDSLSFAQADSTVIAKAEIRHPSIIPKEPDCSNEVFQRAYFTRLESVALFQIRNCDDFLGPESPKRLVFYNFSNGAIYTYGDTIERFNEVFAEQYRASQGLDSKFKFVRLYLATRHPVGTFIILQSPDDFIVLYDSLYSDMENTEEDYMGRKVQRERKTIPEKLKPFKLEEKAGEHVFDFYAYGGNNSIVHWIIRATPEKILVDLEDTVFDKLGWFVKVR